MFYIVLRTCCLQIAFLGILTFALFPTNRKPCVFFLNCSRCHLHWHSGLLEEDHSWWRSPGLLQGNLVKYSQKRRRCPGASALRWAEKNHLSVHLCYLEQLTECWTASSGRKRCKVKVTYLLYVLHQKHEGVSLLVLPHMQKRASVCSVCVYMCVIRENSVTTGYLLVSH